MWKIDTGKQGIDALFKPYQYAAITYCLEAKTNIKTIHVYEHLIEEGIEISRASVINYLAALHSAGVLSHRYLSGKGGFHNVYNVELSLEELITRITNELLNSLIEAFPESDYLKYLKK